MAAPTRSKTSQIRSAGFSMIELIVGIAVLAIMMGAVLGLYSGLVYLTRLAKYKSIGLTMATNQMEYLKSLPYDSLAIAGGSIYSASPLPNSFDKTVDGTTYTVKTDIDYVDDAFDGCGSYPSTAIMQQLCRNYPPPTGSATDTNPKDYKVLDVSVLVKNSGKEVAHVSTQVSARVAETGSTTGALFVNIIDDQGNPVNNASVAVVNNSLSPAVSQSDTTDINGTAIFYDLPPDTTNYDYTITASKSGYSTLTTIVPNGSLQPVYPSQQIIVQQSSFITMTIKPMNTYSLLIEATTTTGTPISNLKIYAKGGYKKYTATSDTSYYFDNMSPDTRPTTDSNGNATLTNLTPGNYIFCGDSASSNCLAGSTTYYLVATIPYGGTNAFNPIVVPTYNSSSPPSVTYPFNGNAYLQKVRLVLTTSSSFPRVYSLNPYEVSKSDSSISSFAFQLTGQNLPCSSNPSSCATTVRFRQNASVFTASCSGTTGTSLSCTVNLSSSLTGSTQLEVVSSGNTFTAPVGMLGGINVTP